MQVIGRSAGRSATAAAAYRSGEQVKDERTGQVHDYTGKSDIYDSEILLPVGAPERLGDRTVLWNEVEQVEKRKDAQLSREVMLALPAELNHWQKQRLAREYVQAEFVSAGMIADIGYHDFDSHNPHAHIMLTMRSVGREGFGKKRREWNKRAAIAAHRQAWAKHANRALERAGYAERIDHRSLEAQGVEREPQIHIGAKVMEMEARGVATQVGAESRRISKVNREIARHQKRRKDIRTEIEIERAFEPTATASPESVSSELSTSPVSKPAVEQSRSVAMHYEPEPFASGTDKQKSGGVFAAVVKHVGVERIERAKAQLADSRKPKPQAEQPPKAQPIEPEEPAPPAKQQPEQSTRKERQKQRQKKRVKEKDQGMSL